MFAALFFMLQATPVSATTAGVQPPRIREPDNFISFRDYPEEALRRGQYGVVSVLLRVSAEGKVESCVVTETAGFPALDRATCSVFRRTRFHPARNVAGLAVGADVRMVTSWGMEGHFPSTRIDLPLQVSKVPADYTSPVKGRILLDASGHVAGCEIEESSGSVAADRAACAYISRKDGFVFSPLPRSGTSGIPPLAVRFFTAPLSKQLYDESTKGTGS